MVFHEQDSVFKGVSANDVNESQNDRDVVISPNKNDVDDSLVVSECHYEDKHEQVAQGVGSSKDNGILTHPVVPKDGIKTLDYKESSEGKN